MSDISSDLKKILQGFLSDNQTMIDDTTPINSLGLESVVVLEFITDVEDHYDINIDLDSLANIQTIADLAEAVKEQGVA